MSRQPSKMPNTHVSPCGKKLPSTINTAFLASALVCTQNMSGSLLPVPGTAQDFPHNAPPGIYAQNG
ncbi:MAG: hypothetical protein DPW18_03400 [Chloroflexi bacterium]|nr:hypothetical protein [Chloroflexota bacterium]MDL1943121.1 hypothetical protein [Chloroflexi bacterium CFX2]